MDDLNVVYDPIEVLILDDQDSVRKTLSKSINNAFQNEFGESFYDIDKIVKLHLFSGLDGFKQYAQTPTSNRQAIIDIRLDPANDENVEGLEAVKYLRESDGRVPIIVNSAHHGKKDVIKDIYTQCYTKSIANNKKIAIQIMEEVKKIFNETNKETFFLVERTNAIIDEIDNDNVNLECFLDGNAYFEILPVNKFKRLETLKIGEKLYVDSYENSLGDTLIKINKSLYDFPINEKYKESNFYKEIENSNSDFNSILESKSFGYFDDEADAKN